MLRRISIPLTVLIMTTGIAFPLDMEKLKPKPTDLERAKKYEHLKDNIAPVKISPAQGQAGNQRPAAGSTARQTAKQKYLFYLFSKSVTDSAIESIFMQAGKLKGVSFFGVLRGVDRERGVLVKIQRLKDFSGITVKVNPMIFRQTGVEMVPAFVYALCPPEETFRSAECDYRLVLYGDLTLLGALERMSEQERDLEPVCRELENAF